MVDSTGLEPVWRVSGPVFLDSVVLFYAAAAWGCAV